MYLVPLVSMAICEQQILCLSILMSGGHMILQKNTTNKQLECADCRILCLVDISREDLMSAVGIRFCKETAKHNLPS